MSINKRVAIIAAIIVIIVVASLAVWYTYYILPPKPAAITELKIGMKMEDVSLDPHMVKSMLGGSISTHIHETLVDLKFEDSKLVGVEPKLAVSWVMVNASAWEFKLRQNVKFHCGHEFTAYDVKYSYDRLMTKFNAFIVGALNRFEVVDKYTIRIGADAPFAPGLFHLAIHFGDPIICSECAKKYGDDYGTKYVCGTGPYKFVEWVKGERIVIEKNEDYWGEKPKINRLIWRPISDDSARVIALETGEVDFITHVPPPQVERLKTKNLKVVVYPCNRIQYAVMDTKKSPFSDRRVRQAVNYAIDRESIVKELFAGLATVPDSYMPPGTFGYKKIGFQYDPNKAKQLLAEAGYPNGFDCEFWTVEGRWLMDRQTSEAVTGYLRAVGIRASLVVLEWGAWVEKTMGQIDIYMKGEKPTYDIFWSSWATVTYDGDYALIVNFASPELNLPGCWNEGLVTNSTLDDLMLRARASTDPNERYNLYVKAQEILVQEAPWAPVVIEPLIVAMKPTLSNVILLPNEGYFLYSAYYTS